MTRMHAMTFAECIEALEHDAPDLAKHQNCPKSEMVSECISATGDLSWTYKPTVKLI